MRFISKLLLVTLALWGCAASLKAQDTLRRHAVGYQFMYMFNAGIRIDYDRRIGPYSWLSLGPQFYQRDGGPSQFPYINEYDFRQITGYGLNAETRIYLQKPYLPAGSYLSGGMLFQQFFAVFPDEYGMDYKQQNVKLGLNAMLGMQTFAKDFVFVDMYSGLGLRHSFYFTEEGKAKHYMGRNPWMYGFSGVVLLFGIRVGLLL